MQKWLRSIESKFWTAIGAGGVAFLLVVLAVSLVPHQKGPNETSEQAGHQQDGTNTPQRIVTNIIGSAVIIPGDQRRAAKTNQDDTANSNGDFFPSFWEIKSTDLALVLFTYCLVVVGWATMRKSDQTMRQIERGRIYVGVIPNLMSIVGGISNMPVGFANQGKTTAIVEEIGCVFSATEPTGDVASYSGALIARPNTAVHPGFISAIAQHTFQSPYTGVQYCAAYARYSDIFGKTHTARYCCRLDPQNKTAETAGTPIWNLDAI